MKLELNLTEAEHRYLLEAAAHDRSFRSLASFTKDCLIAGLNSVASEYLGTHRREATAALIAAGNAGKTKGKLVTR
jgi:hypothetical protein